MYGLPIHSSPTDGRTDSFSPSILSSSRYLFILGDFNCHHPLWESRGTSNIRGEKAFDWFISSDLLPLNDPDTPIYLNFSSRNCSSPDILFAPYYLALSCPREVLQTSVLTIYYFSYPSLSIFLPQRAPPFLQFLECSLQ